MDFLEKSNVLIYASLAILGLVIAIMFVINSNKRKVAKDKRSLAYAAQFFLDSPDFHLFTNAQLKTSAGMVNLDYLLVGQTGVYVIQACEFINPTSGNERDSSWTEKNLTHPFQIHCSITSQT